MPAHTGPDSLYEICVKQISTYYSVNDAWDYKSDCGPLDHVPAVIVEDLYIHAITAATFSIGKFGTKWKDSWRVFLTPTVRWAFITWNAKYLEIVKRRCRNLQCLCVQIVGDIISVKTLLQGIQILGDTVPVEALIELKQMYSVVDFDCDFLYQHEPYVDQKLRMMGIQKQGWFAKILSKKHNVTRPDIEISNLSWMQELRVTGLQLTLDDICSILYNCVQLQILCHKNVASALYKIYKENPDNLPSFNLQNIELTLDTNFSTEETLTAVVRLCPFMRMVDVTIKERISPNALKPLLNLKNIQNLSICHILPVEMSGEHYFETEVVPLIKKYGECLRVLRLNGMSMVDVGFILTLCPNLRWLALMRNIYGACVIGETRCVPLKELKFLYLFAAVSERNIFLNSWYEALLSSPSLQDVLLGCLPVDSEVFSSLFRDNLLNNLKLFSVFSCDGLSYENVISLLSLKNDLVLLGVKNCVLVGMEEIVSIEQFIKTNCLKCRFVHNYTGIF